MRGVILLQDASCFGCCKFGLSFRSGHGGQKIVLGIKAPTHLDKLGHALLGLGVKSGETPRESSEPDVLTRHTLPIDGISNRDSTGATSDNLLSAHA